MGFRYYLINEEQVHLGHKIADIMTAIHELEADMGGMGARQIARVSEEIVNQIRKVLHSQWGPNQSKNLKELQKVAVALMQAIEEKDDLREIIGNLSKVIEKIAEKLGIKINRLDAVPEEGGENIDQQDMQLTGNGPAPPQQQQNMMPPDQMMQAAPPNMPMPPV